MPNATETKSTSADAGRIVARLRRRCVLAAWLAMIGVLTGSLWLQRTYELSVTLERRAPQSDAAQGQSTLAPWSPRLVNDLLTPAEARRVAQRLAPDEATASLHRHLYQHVRVHPLPAEDGISRVRLSYTGPDAALGRQLLEAIAQQQVANDAVEQPNQQPAKVKQKKRKPDKQSRNEPSPDQTVQRTKIAMRQAREALESFEQKHQQLLGASPKEARARLKQVRAELQRLQRDRRATLTRIDALGNALARTPTQLRERAFATNPQRGALAARQRELADLIDWLIVTRKMRAAHPTMTELVKRRRQIKSALDEMPGEVMTVERHFENPAHQKLRAQLVEARMRAQTLASTIADQRAPQQRWTERAQQASAFARHHAELQRQWQTARQAHHSAQTEAAIAAQMEQAKQARPMERAVAEAAASSDPPRAHFAYAAPPEITSHVRWPSVTFIGVSAVVAGLFAAIVALCLPIAAHAQTPRQSKRPRTIVTWLTERIQAMLARPAGALLLAATVIALSGLTYLRIERPTLMHHLQRQAPAWLGLSGPTAARASERNAPDTPPTTPDGSDDTSEAPATRPSP